MDYVLVEGTPVGRVAIAANDEAITALYFMRDGAALPDDWVQRETPLLARAVSQLQAYFARERMAFDLPLAPEGTPFAKRVWEALQTIPYGETRTYAQIAQQVGSPRAMRAVGGANSRNPISIFIPCHRVIGANGTLTGYAGGIDSKAALLSLEGQPHSM